MIKNFLKRILSFNYFLHFIKGRKMVLCYHDISDQNAIQHSEHYSTPIQLFKEQIHFVKKHFTIVSIDELLNGNLKWYKNYAAITFDDGFLSVKNVAHPFLSTQNIPYSLFVNKQAIEENRLWVSDLAMTHNMKDYEGLYDYVDHSKVDKSSFLINPIYGIMYHGKFSSEFLQKVPQTSGERIYLNAEEIKQLNEEGVHIGNHTTNHYNLSQLSNTEQKEQIEANKSFINNLGLQNKDNVFAIPFGKKEHFNEETISELHAQGYQHILGTNPILFSDEKTVIPRIVITDESIHDILFYINRSILRKIDL